MEKPSCSMHNQGESSCHDVHGGGHAPTFWSKSADDLDYGEEDFPNMENMDGDYPLKRRQRRQRLHSLHCYVARTGVMAVGVTASILASQVEHMTRHDIGSHCNEDTAGEAGVSSTFCAVFSNVKSTLGCAIGSAAGRVGELAGSLANAIGEPPQRALANRDEQDAPLLLFWAINLCAVCTIASLVLFIMCFCSSPDLSSTEVSSDSEAVESIQVTTPSPLLSSNGTEPAATTQGRKLEGFFRVLGVVSLSLVSGCGLGLRHPIQSALLSGF